MDLVTTTSFCPPPIVIRVNLVILLVRTNDLDLLRLVLHFHLQPYFLRFYPQVAQFSSFWTYSVGLGWGMYHGGISWISSLYAYEQMYIITAPIIICQTGNDTLHYEYKVCRMPLILHDGEGSTWSNVMKSWGFWGETVRQLTFTVQILQAKIISFFCQTNWLTND